ncbi:uncharacterized protein Z519_07168 [Cladophialophora bantiana CBS 173.52]|uniref:Ubiquitin-like domain-containing protein n=1 Tax=Cladophialophora bantiana (strain ATCC 10958 / CBS 173.52 / CDC B-1940 / NIH 8579) TaxID=1442370 RepID=A0A0D2I5K5_CLAB1|nr:uncharacterized protein Z519_07168 [Cladophialophora bantiana CBS 173.52]KIW92184.1 hypothetical protein Z519_07168 [Cladophialophora bantiana CBS 173.52]
MPAFGVSVGDVIATIELIQKLLGALKSTTGAAAHYQRTIIEIGSLGRVLRDIERLAANDIDDDTTRINSLRAAAFATWLTLRDFLQRLQKIIKAMQWTLSMDEEVDKLQLYVAGQLLSIITQLQMLGREISSRREARRRAEHEQLSNVMQSYSHAVKDISTMISSMANDGDRHRREVESLARHVTRNTRMLTDLSQSINQGPSNATDTITLYDPLGRKFSLPYTYFKHFLTALLNTRSQRWGLPGSIQVKHGNFVISPTSSDGKALAKSGWTSNIFPGAAFAMTIVLTMLKLPVRQCPRPSCGYKFSDITETETDIRYLPKM